METDVGHLLPFPGGSLLSHLVDRQLFSLMIDRERSEPSPEAIPGNVGEDGTRSFPGTLFFPMVHPGLSDMSDMSTRGRVKAQEN